MFHGQAVSPATGSAAKLAPRATLSLEWPHDYLARAARRQRRSEAPGNSGLPADQGPARIRCGETGVDLALRQARLSDPRRHPDHAARRSAPAGLTFVRDRARCPARRIIRSATHFQLTRVTRIFQKSVFTKAAPSSPGETCSRAFLLGAERPAACGSERNLRVREQGAGAASLLWGCSLQRALQLERVVGSRLVFRLREAMNGRDDKAAITGERK